MWQFCLHCLIETTADVKSFFEIRNYHRNKKDSSALKQFKKKTKCYLRDDWAVIFKDTNRKIIVYWWTLEIRDDRAKTRERKNSELMLARRSKFLWDGPNVVKDLIIGLIWVEFKNITSCRRILLGFFLVVTFQKTQAFVLT